MLTRLAPVGILLCCAGLMFGTAPAVHADDAAKSATPGRFSPPDRATPLHSTREGGEQDRYGREAGTARTTTLESPRNIAPQPANDQARNAPLPSMAEPLPISRPAAHKPTGDPAAKRSDPASRSSGGASSLVAVVGSLAIVVGLFFLVMWLLRRGMPKGSHLLPGEVVEVLGRTPLGARQHAHLLRCGNKLLLVSLSAAGAETLTEVTDPVEVDRLAGLCRQSQPQSATAAFRQIFQQFGRDRSARGFLDSTPQGSAEAVGDTDHESAGGQGEELHV